MVALPHVRDDLGFSPTALSWAQNAYTLAFGGMLLLGATRRRPARPAAHVRRRHRAVHRRVAGGRSRAVARGARRRPRGAGHRRRGARALDARAAGDELPG